LDKVPDTALKMEELLARARAAAADVARIRAGATPAGDAQPYRVVGEEGTNSGDDNQDTGDRDRLDD
jgi:ribosome-binding factor A